MPRVQLRDARRPRRAAPHLRHGPHTTTHRQTRRQLVQTLPHATAPGTRPPARNGTARRHGTRAAPRRATRHHKEPAGSRRDRRRAPQRWHARRNGGGPHHLGRGSTPPQADHHQPRHHGGATPASWPAPSREHASKDPPGELHPQAQPQGASPPGHLCHCLWHPHDGRLPAGAPGVWCTPGSGRIVLNVTCLRQYSSLSGTDESGDVPGPPWEAPQAECWLLRRVSPSHRPSTGSCHSHSTRAVAQ